MILRTRTQHRDTHTHTPSTLRCVQVRFVPDRRAVPSASVEPVRDVLSGARCAKGHGYDCVREPRRRRRPS